MKERTKKAFMFPGQGSQYVGMGKALYEKDKETQMIYREAAKILKFPVREVSFYGPPELLTNTKFAQPAIFLASYVAFRFIKRRKEEMPDCFFGHSLGEFTALTAAEALEYEEALELVNLRGKLMELAGKKQKGGMAAVIGIEGDEVEKVVNSTKGRVTIANFNTPEQFVISGEEEALVEAIEELRERGAKRIVKLRVSAAFHSPLMKEAAEEFSEFLDKVEIKRPKKPVITNSNGKITTDPEEIKRALKMQMTSPVLFVKMLEEAKNFGIRKFFEIGPGNVLQGLVRRTLKDVEVGGYDPGRWDP